MRAGKNNLKMAVLQGKMPTDFPNDQVWEQKQVSGRQIVEIRARNSPVQLALGRLLKISNRRYGTDGKTPRDCHFRRSLEAIPVGSRVFPFGNTLAQFLWTPQQQKSVTVELKTLEGVAKIRLKLL